MSGEHFFDVAIIGGGISGTSLLYTLARYTNIKKVALFEKCDEIASLNSNAKSNSQTLHAGDIETNYSLKKALKVKKSADMLENYARRHGYENKSIFNFPKMVIAVGNEVPYMKSRYREFKEHYPYLKFWDKERLGELEPKLIEGRESDIVSMGSTEQFCAMDFGKISKSFVKNAKKQECDVEVCLQEEVYSIKERGNVFELLTSKGTYFAYYVVVDAGSHSLLLANDMGYGLEYSTLPVGGSFYYAKKQFINSKVYTVQNPKLPFAAVHADPDIIHNDITRFGPTALALPKLERYKGADFIDFMKTLNPDKAVFDVFYDLLSDGDIREYMIKNMMYEIPVIRNGLFAKEVQKIIPTLGEDDIEYADGIGGLRPQVIDKVNKKLLLGEAKIDTKKGLVFNMTPSPGATSCLSNAKEDAKQICAFLGKKFYKKNFKKELLEV